jgi:hypothetical protein
MKNSESFMETKKMSTKTKYKLFGLIKSSYSKEGLTDALRRNINDMFDTTEQYLYVEELDNCRDKQYYQKIGKKFVPLRSEYDTLGMSKGSYLMQIKPGCTSYVRMVENPARLEVEAAIGEFKDELAKLIVEAQSCRTRTPITRRQAKLWEKWNKEAGEDFFKTLTIESAQDTVDKVVDFLRKKIQEKQVSDKQVSDKELALKAD